jgi:RNA polymerase sigma-B factor
VGVGADRSPQLDGWSPPGGDVTSCVAGTEPFAVVVNQRDPAVVVSVIGEIDELTESPLEDHLSGVLAARPARLIIDLSRITFLGAAGLSVLINARHTAVQQGTTLQLRAPHRQGVARSLEITGLDRLFEILPPDTDRDEADPTRVTGVPQPHEADQDEYAALLVLQRRYAELPSDDPERQRLRDTVIRGYLPVAAHIARRFAGRGEPLEDLIQVATVGLVNAVDRFEPARGSHFLSFAVPTITGELRRYFRDHAWSTRVPRRVKDLSMAIRTTLAELSQQLGRSPRPSEIADRLGLPTSKVLEALHAGEAYRSASLDEMLSCGDTPATYIGELDSQMSLIDDRETLRPLLAELPPRERAILILRFFHQLTQTQIAEQVGLSQMHVSRVLRRTLAFLQERMTSKG